MEPRVLNKDDERYIALEEREREREQLRKHIRKETLGFCSKLTQVDLGGAA